MVLQVLTWSVHHVVFGIDLWKTLQLLIFILTIFLHPVIEFPFLGCMSYSFHPTLVLMIFRDHVHLVWILRFLPFFSQQRSFPPRFQSSLKMFGESFVPFDMLQTSEQFEENQPWLSPSFLYIDMDSSSVETPSSTNLSKMTSCCFLISLYFVSTLWNTASSVLSFTFYLEDHAKLTCLKITATRHAQRLCWIDMLEDFAEWFTHDGIAGLLLRRTSKETWFIWVTFSFSS